MDPLNVIALGVGATAFIDLWAVAARRLFDIPLPNFCLVGRWLCYMPAGVFSHRSIAAAPAKQAECAVGWAMHYATGIVFALALVALASFDWLREPTFVPAMAVGMVTVGFPFFVMQPAFGFGMAASKTANPWQARRRSLTTHAVFGLGLYLSALILSALVV